MGYEIQNAVNGAIPASDPKLEDTLATRKRPDIGPMGKDPDRYTIHVPSEQTTVSLGQKWKKNDERNEVDANYIQDVGITGRTDNHVHFHVQKNHKTIVSLGGPATSVKMDGPHDAKVPTESVGYAMITDENAWHEAAKQHYLVSRTADIVVRTVADPDKATALLQSDKGTVTIAAGQAITLGGKGNVKIMSLTAAPVEAEPSYTGVVQRKVTAEFDKQYADSAKATTDHLTAVHDKLTEAVKAQKKKAKWKKADWEDVSAAEVQPLLDAIKGLCDKLAAALKKDTLGSVDFLAESHLSVGAEHVSVHGKTSASLSSAATAEVSGDNVGVGAKTTLGLWAGSHASFKSGKDVSIEAETGELTMQASKDVAIASETEGVIVQGEKDAQLNGKTGKAFVHGKTSVYAGAGDAGYGMLATDSKVQVAKMPSANNFDSPGPDAAHGMTVDSSMVKTAFGESTVEVEDAGITVKSAKIELNATGDAVTVNAKRIQLG